MRFVMTLIMFIGIAAFASIGQKTQNYKDAARSRTLTTFIWYPAPETSKAIAVGHGSFQPVMAAVDAPLLKQSGKFPVILLSHGSGGKADKLFWLTEQLVKNGFVVIAVNHVGNMTGDNSGKGLIEVWERPRDLTFALDRVLSQPDFKNSLDTDRIAAIGHSAGGTTALLLGGAKFSPDRFQSPVPHCLGTKDPYFAVWCKEIQSLDLKSYKKEITGGDHSDRRVSAVIAFDPGFAKSFDSKSIGKIKNKTYIFIAEKLYTPFDEIYSKEFSGLVGKENSEIVPSSVHMSFLQACQAKYPKEDPELSELCANNDLKIEIQEKTAAKTISFLKSIWLK
jgi:predicted dienelactone hydrolase